MKRYRKYMDNIKATDTLRQRLRELETPVKRHIPWKRYGAMAAALALVLGLGYAHYYNTVVSPRGQAFLEATLSFDPAAHPDIAWEDPNGSEPGQKALEGYDVREERGGVAVTVRYILPYIEYGEVGTAVAKADWDIPEGAVKRDLPRDEIIALMGGEDAVNTHLDWGGYELTGWAAWCEDGTFWGAYINGRHTEWLSDTFEFAVTAGQLPPVCVVSPGEVTQKIRGLTITAVKNDWELGGESLTQIPERRVSFFKGVCGYRFTVNSGDTEQAERLVSRLVCRIADEGLGADLTDAYAEMRAGICSTCGEEIVPGTRHFHRPTYTCPDCGQTMAVDGMRAHVHSFINPEAANPDDNAPPVSVSEEPYVCTGYPTPDPAESREVCGYPPALSSPAIVTVPAYD